MKGELFNILEAFVVQTFGEDAYNSIYEAVENNLSTKDPFVGPGTYPDGDMLTLVGEAVVKTKLLPSVLLKQVGRFAFPILANKVKEHTRQFSNIKDFLKSVHSVIHVEVRKVYADAEPPHFEYIDPDENSVIMIYKSKRKLYDLAEGLLEGAGEYFKVNMEIKRKIISTEAGEPCEFHIRST